MLQVKRKAAPYFEFLLILFAISYFLTLGFDFSAQLTVRKWYGVLFFVFTLFIIKKQDSWGFLKSKSLCAFAVFLSYEVVRALWALWQMKVCHAASNDSVPLKIYLTSLGEWGFYLGAFFVTWLYLNVKARMARFLWVLSVSGFFLAVNALPALIRTAGAPGYDMGLGRRVFFFPFLYHYDWISQYILGSFGHVNITGDVIGFGLFPAIGLMIYAFMVWFTKEKERRDWHEFAVPTALPAVMAASSALAIILFFSRGEILSFSGASIFFTIALLLKYPSKTYFAIVIAAILLIASFLIYAGNLKGVKKELNTVESEFGETGGKASFDTNREGAKRAIAIYHDYSLSGVGTRGYSIVAKKYATPETYEKYGLAQFRTMCHYLQILAEEGAGAFLYFFFLIVYLVEMLVGLVKTKSRFQFVAALSLLTSVLVVLIHSAINHLMQNFTVAMLLYLVMGASLSTLRKDFDHQN